MSYIKAARSGDAHPGNGMFDFRQYAAAPLFLSPSTGEPVHDQDRDDEGRCPGGRAGD